LRSHQNTDAAAIALSPLPPLLLLLLLLLLLPLSAVSLNCDADSACGVRLGNSQCAAVARAVTSCSGASHNTPDAAHPPFNPAAFDKCSLFQ
jgi:hypothetical protein